MSEQDIQTALNNAKEEGKFQGTVLQTLRSIDATLKNMDKVHTEQNLKIDNKADRAEVTGMRTEFDDVKKKVLMAAGGLIVLQIVIGIYISINF